MIEEWKPVWGYEGIYEVSNLGRVRSVDRLNSYGRKNRGKLLKQTPLPDTRYLYVKLLKDGKSKMFKIHRLVAMTFIGEPKNGEVVDHIDGDRQNNNLENLRFVSQRENTALGKMRLKKTSRFTGVSIIRKTGLWRVSKKFGSQNLPIGHFMNEEMAAYIYSSIQNLEQALYFKKHKTLLNTPVL